MLYIYVYVYCVYIYICTVYMTLHKNYQSTELYIYSKPEKDAEQCIITIFELECTFLCFWG